MRETTWALLPTSDGIGSATSSTFLLPVCCRAIVCSDCSERTRRLDAHAWLLECLVDLMLLAIVKSLMLQIDGMLSD